MTAEIVKKKLNAHIFERQTNDWYVEPEWCSNRLFEKEPFDGVIIDPSCGIGRIVHAARRHGLEAYGCDIVQRHGICAVQQDFMSDNWESPVESHFIKNIVSNPPYNLCNSRSGFSYIKQALNKAIKKVALLLPASFDCSESAYFFLRETKPIRKWILTPRPSMPSGECIERGEKPNGGKVNFAWYIWEHGHNGDMITRWIHRDDS
jgi:hypothetical protein